MWFTTYNSHTFDPKVWEFRALNRIVMWAKCGALLSFSYRYLFIPNWSLGFLNKLVAPKNYAFDIDSSSQKIIFLTFQGQAADLPRSRC